MDNNTMNYNSSGQTDPDGNNQYTDSSQYSGDNQPPVDGQYGDNSQSGGNNQYITAPDGMNEPYNANHPYSTNNSYNVNGQYGMPGYGQPSQYYQPYQESIYAQPGESGPMEGKAVASLICGVFSLLTCCCYGIPSLIFGIIAIVLAVLSRKDNMGQMPGLAIAGMIMGVLGVISGIGYIAFLFFSIFLTTV